MKEGVNYNIITESEFDSKIETKKFITLVTIKLYSEHQCINYLKTLYIEKLITTDNYSITDIVDYILNINNFNFKSKSIQTYIAD